MTAGSYTSACTVTQDAHRPGPIFGYPHAGQTATFDIRSAPPHRRYSVPVDYPERGKTNPHVRILVQPEPSRYPSRATRRTGFATPPTDTSQPAGGGGLPYP